MNNDLVLVQARIAQGTVPSADRLCAAYQRVTGTAAAVHRVAVSVDGTQLYAYLDPRDALLADSPGVPVAAALADAISHSCSWASGVRVSRLECMRDIAGASSGAPARFHYVVETDPEDGWMDEIARWYDTEHMPGLAAVDGCIRAMRFINHGHGPRSLACYDLVTRETLGSAPWLAVRATAWSDIARPHFTNTLRTMFEVPSPVIPPGLQPPQA